jgi:hypothetical protein
LNLISRAWAFYTIWDQKIQWKEKLSEYLTTEEKIKSWLEKDIQNKIKEMRMWKKVLEDDALEMLSTWPGEETTSAKDEKTKK